ncbi:uncharacterized protein EV422DRAFT_532073 [Fimicolochytrium jonesii]|uniref:uncharacterized protein n=1 Tax=Fimicolochytrium jonesii TaxID=1396493 RepID=UPI0022FF3808|nr:uncharacterized protein EV422DRAFT_532073 [Fimicolochytrium jonesii]KAI8820220.1 hypothetical protein EV422DRAFT_532073 [Fimicolochytrium jonesii]
MLFQEILEDDSFPLDGFLNLAAPAAEQEESLATSTSTTCHEDDDIHSRADFLEQGEIFDFDEFVKAKGIVLKRGRSQSTQGSSSSSAAATSHGSALSTFTSAAASFALPLSVPPAAPANSTQFIPFMEPSFTGFMNSVARQEPALPFSASPDAIINARHLPQYATAADPYQGPSAVGATALQPPRSEVPACPVHTIGRQVPQGLLGSRAHGSTPYHRPTTIRSGPDSSVGRQTGRPLHAQPRSTQPTSTDSSVMRQPGHSHHAEPRNTRPTSTDSLVVRQTHRLLHAQPRNSRPTSTGTTGLQALCGPHREASTLRTLPRTTAVLTYAMPTMPASSGSRRDVSASGPQSRAPRSTSTITTVAHAARPPSGRRQAVRDSSGKRPVGGILAATPFQNYVMAGGDPQYFHIYWANALELQQQQFQARPSHPPPMRASVPAPAQAHIPTRTVHSISAARLDVDAQTYYTFPTFGRGSSNASSTSPEDAARKRKRPASGAMEEPRLPISANPVPLATRTPKRARTLVPSSEAGPSGSSLTTVSQKGRRLPQVPHACVPCRTHHFKCNVERPCETCSEHGWAAFCFDLPHKRRGRPRNSKTKTKTAGALPPPSPPPPPGASGFICV